MTEVCLCMQTKDSTWAMTVFWFFFLWNNTSLNTNKFIVDVNTVLQHKRGQMSPQTIWKWIPDMESWHRKCSMPCRKYNHIFFKKDDGHKLEKECYLKAFSLSLFIQVHINFGSPYPLNFGCTTALLPLWST